MVLAWLEFTRTLKHVAIDKRELNLSFFHFRGRVVRWLRCRELLCCIVGVRPASDFVRWFVERKSSQRIVGPWIAQKCVIGAKVRTSKDLTKRECEKLSF